MLSTVRLPLTVSLDLLHSVVARNKPIEARCWLFIYLQWRVPELGREDIVTPLRRDRGFVPRQRSP